MKIKEKLCESLGFQFLFLCVIGILVYNTSVYAEDAEDWMPDPALREAVREKLQLPDATPLRTSDMAKFRELVVIESDIADLRGLEHAVNLRFLHLSRGQIVDITPLAGLVSLEVLKLYRNQIIDITPLANLVNLERLELQYNQIIDFTPLFQLRNLKSIRVAGNPGDFSPILELDVAKNWVCLLEDTPIAERTENRRYPSVFHLWGTVLNRPELSFEEKLSDHDLYLSSLMFNMGWYITPEDVKIVGDLESAQHERAALLSYNPNMIFLSAIYFYGAPADWYPEDWQYWLRDASGNRIQEPGYEDFLIDFTQSGAQDFFVQQAIAVAECGLYDGIFLDWWVEDRSILYNRAGIEDIDSKYAKMEIDAKLSMLKRIREAVGDEFLILVNTVQYKAPRSAPYVNGTFMETDWNPNIGAYTHEQLTQIESTLSWSEENFREPQINCLEGSGQVTENPDSPTNRRWMRVFTTMSLTHSDGYVLYHRGDSDKEHIWYDFWDADLGRPVGGDETKGQLYENREGLFIREFTNGWAVYNRSGNAQEISLPIQAKGVASGITATQHTVPDLDGEMYLKQKTGASADVNGDGVVNIQDLVIVANALGEAEPDLNGDGVVNIQDLVIVANAF